MERYLSAKKIADLLEISRRSAYDLIYKMPCYLDQPLRVPERIFKQYLEEHTIYQPERLKGRRTA